MITKSVVSLFVLEITFYQTPQASTVDCSNSYIMSDEMHGIGRFPALLLDSEKWDDEKAAFRLTCGTRDRRLPYLCGEADAGWVFRQSQ